MSDEEIDDVPLFDPTMKKKKKKKPVVEDVDDDIDADDEPIDFGKKKKKKKAPVVEDDDEDDEDFDFGKKKKKKKSADAVVPDDEDDDEVQDFGKKKKKKKKVVEEDDDYSDDDEDTNADAGADAWLDGSDRDYTYKEPQLLNRVFNILDQNNPDLISRKKNRITMKPPSVFREGTKKTVWANFREICKSMGRSTEHVQAFALAELGTNGSVDGSHRLVIKGRFNPKQIESVIKHYIAEYVTCRTCKSHETNLKKENRLYFVQCLSCGSSRSVAAIKTGFQAQVGKRRRMRKV